MKLRCGRCGGMSPEDEKNLREKYARAIVHATDEESQKWAAITERDVAVSAAAVQNKACAEEMLARQHMQNGWDTMVASVKQHYEAQLYAEAISRELRDFTMHQDNCRQLDVWRCTCGLSDLLSKL